MTEPVDQDVFLARLIRIETRLARIQQHMGLPTRMDSESTEKSEYAREQPIGRRLARIETRVFKLLEAMNINPKTGQQL